MCSFVYYIPSHDYVSASQTQTVCITNTSANYLQTSKPKVKLYFTPLNNQVLSVLNLSPINRMFNTTGEPQLGSFGFQYYQECFSSCVNT